MTKRLFCMGNPLLDITANVDEDLLRKYDITLNNAVLAGDHHLPLFQELVDRYPVDYTAGGATQNSARVCQWLLRTPGQVTFVGCVGKDKFAEELAHAARKDGLNLHYLVSEDTPTGTCAVVVHGKERSLVARLGAAEQYNHEHVKSPEVAASLEAAGVVYISCFFLTHSAKTILYVAQHCAEHNKIFCMNLSAPFIMQVPPFAEKVREFWPYLDFIFANESEAAAFAAMQGWEGVTNLNEIALKAAALPKINTARPRYVVFTNGKSPTVVASSTGEVKEYPVPLVPGNEIVDTNGAGDAMVGGFLSQLVKDRSIEQCIDIGHWAAGVIIRRSGATFPETPGRDDI